MGHKHFLALRMDKLKSSDMGSFEEAILNETVYGMRANGQFKLLADSTPFGYRELAAQTGCDLDKFHQICVRSVHTFQLAAPALKKAFILVVLIGVQKTMVGWP